MIKDKKISVAFWSIIAALFLTSIKLIVGIITNSLGILAEALHSGLDLVAAAITFLAVYYSKKPPDKDHPFGHGRIENFSALIETGILIITCGWILYEAVERALHPVSVEVNIFSFAVMIIAIVIDYERSRMLYKVAKETNSQALEADALHFSTDILSSSVVIIGLIFVGIGFPIGDSIAALVVALIVIWISVRLGKKTIRSLLDHEPGQERTLIENFLQKEYPEVKVNRLRLRESGPQIQGDLNITTPDIYSLIDVHSIIDDIESKIKKIVPNIDILIYVTPEKDSGKMKGIYERYYVILKTTTVLNVDKMEIHDIVIYNFKNELKADLHMLLPSDLSLDKAHDVTEKYEEIIKKKIPELNSLHIHIEPFEEKEQKFELTDDYEIRALFYKITNKYENVKKVKQFAVISNDNRIILQSTIILDPKIDLETAHKTTELIESELIKEIPNIQRITIHTEPSSS
jgi:cation diffusion facilitator family transporter